MSGPGTELKRLLRRLGITPRSGCGCDKRAQVMDELGADWCAENAKTVVNWLEEGARIEGYPFIRPAAYLLVSMAIRRAKKHERTEQSRTSIQTEARD